VTTSAEWTDNLLPRIADEVCCIVDCFRDERIEIDGVAEYDGGVDYMYAKDWILVRAEYLLPVVGTLLRGRVSDDLRSAPPLTVNARVLDTFGVRPVINGVLLLPLKEFGLSVPAALAFIDERFGAGVATPDHVLTVSSGGGEVTPCAATEPQTVYNGIEPNPGVCWDNSGSGVRVYIADTGLLADADSHSWLHGVQRAVKPDGAPQPFDPLGPPAESGLPSIPAYAGHGTFVAGVLRCLAREADVIVSDVFNRAGSALESEAVPDLVNALGLGVDIFHLSMAAPSRKNLPLISFEAWLKLLSQYKGVSCVVAAGNSGSRRPSWPAAFSEMVAVGALAADWRDRADFSNYGGWVDVYAPGRNLINAFATGAYTCYVAPYAGTPRTFYGMAQWSGTSFSAPIVTGLIAARMSRTGENGQEAAAAMLRLARSQAIPGVGAILLPCDGTADRRRQACAPRCCCTRETSPNCC
jgi:Subtilase family